MCRSVALLASRGSADTTLPAAWRRSLASTGPRAAMASWSAALSPSDSALATLRLGVPAGPGKSSRDGRAGMGAALSMVSGIASLTRAPASPTSGAAAAEARPVRYRRLAAKSGPRAARSGLTASWPPASLPPADDVLSGVAAEAGPNVPAMTGGPIAGAALGAPPSTAPGTTSLISAAASLNRDPPAGAALPAGKVGGSSPKSVAPLFPMLFSALLAAGAGASAPGTAPLASCPNAAPLPVGWEGPRARPVTSPVKSTCAAHNNHHGLADACKAS